MNGADINLTLGEVRPLMSSITVGMKWNECHLWFKLFPVFPGCHASNSAFAAVGSVDAS